MKASVLPQDPPLARNAGGSPGQSALDLAEMILKDPVGLEARLRDPEHPLELIPRLLGIALACFTLFGTAFATLLCLSPSGPPLVPAVGGPASALSLVLAYDVGLIAACGVCLPSFYFYGLLAGVRASMLQVTVHALKGLAVAGVILVALLPIYLPVALGLVVFGAPQESLERTLFAGLFLPFVAGLFGLRSLYRGFLGLADTMPAEKRCRRGCFLRRLVTAWAGVYTAVTPVMIYTLWQRLAS